MLIYFLLCLVEVLRKCNCYGKENVRGFLKSNSDLANQNFFGRWHGICTVAMVSIPKPFGIESVPKLFKRSRQVERIAMRQRMITAKQSQPFQRKRRR
jgi:hypothetical protein